MAKYILSLNSVTNLTNPQTESHRYIRVSSLYAKVYKVNEKHFWFIINSNILTIEFTFYTRGFNVTNKQLFDNHKNIIQLICGKTDHVLIYSVLFIKVNITRLLS